MTTRTQAEADLAFMKGLVEGRPAKGLEVFGRVYLVAGLLYGAQALGFLWQASMEISFAPLGQLVFAYGPTAVFLTYLTWEIWRGRRMAQGGPTWRAAGAVFAGVGMANLALVVMLGVLSDREQNIMLWLLHPAIVFILQGAAWFVVGMLRRQAAPYAVAMGWFVVGVVMGLSTGTLLYIQALTFGLLGLMAAPGAVMIWLARRPA